MSKQEFKINGFHCESCVKLATMKIKKIPGVQTVDIRENGEAVVEAEHEISYAQLSEAVAAAGHTIEKA